MGFHASLGECTLRTVCSTLEILVLEKTKLMQDF